MAAVNSPIRDIVKPLLYKLLPEFLYKKIQVRAKYRDIKFKMVEEPEMELLPRLIQTGTEVIDVGANYAYYTEKLSNLVGPDGHVYSFEPIPFTYDVAIKLLDLFNLRNVTYIQKGVGEKDETLMFRIPRQSFGAISAGLSHIAKRNNDFKERDLYYAFSSDEYINAEVISLDSYLLSKVKNVTLIKIDIEGAEYFALKGMKELLKKFKPVVIVEIQYFFLEGYGLTINNLLDLINKELGYNIYIYDPKEKMIKNVDLNAVWMANYILIHRDKLDQYKYLIK
ncbi:MAG: FkbM family methyltransferase [Bacteroidetes bacterium]|nr:FkbM family methyltransferase [Bacteroidota bacterium]